MNFKRYFSQLAQEKAKTHKRKVDSSSAYYQLVMRDMAFDLRDYIQQDDIFVKPSVGQGNYADIPWICLLSTNASISPNAQKGLYIVLLFHKTGDSFYLALSQGITNFKNMKLKPGEMHRIIADTVSYFQNEVPREFIELYGFSMDQINLGESISTLAKGYIETTILAKRYQVNDFNETDFYQSLSRLVHEYQEIIDHIGSKTYDDVLALINPQENVEQIEDALEEIHMVLKEEFVEHRDTYQTPIKVERGALKSNRYQRIAQERIYKKVDHIKQAKEHYQIGLKGEQLALEIERKRLLDLGLDPDKYIKWCSVESDSYGYDFESVDVVNQALYPIYVEVKATKDIKDSAFFVSKNELEVSKEKKSAYRVFRIFDITSIAPKYYIASGEIETNFYLDPVTYSARYKYDVV